MGGQEVGDERQGEQRDGVAEPLELLTLDPLSAPEPHQD
jgi:hypothetical protein